MASSSSSVTSRREGGDGDVPEVELRASILDAAISLGFRNSVMKKWMFDAVPEGEDDETAEHSTPALTSPSTSEESSLSPYSFRQPDQISYPYAREGTVNSSNLGSGGPGEPNSGLGIADPLITNANVNLAGPRFPHEDDMNSPSGTHKGSFGMLAHAVPPPKNKLRKQKSAFVMGGANGYDSDGGYLAEVTKKTKNKKGLGWRKKNRGDGGGGDSDGGYRSEAASSSAVAKAKAQSKKKMGEKEVVFKSIDTATPSPRLPSMSLDEDPEAFLATVKASVLNNSKPGSGSGSTPEPSSGPTYAPGPSSSSGHEHGPTMTTDGYFTDSEKRGRTKKKAKAKTRSDSPTTGDDGYESSSARTPRKKKSLFRLMGRSMSRDAKDRDRPKAEQEEAPPLPEPFRPPMPLPIAGRFARSGAGTPVGNASATSSPSPDPGSLALGVGLRVGEGTGTTGLTKSASSMDLPIRSSGSLSTLAPPTLHDPDHARSGSPWSYRSAPGRIGASGEYGRDGSGSNSLELPREKKNSGGWSPFIVIPRSPESGRNINEGGGSGATSERPGSPSLSNTHSTINAPGSPDSGKSPTTTRIGKFFNAFGGQSSKGDSRSDDGHYSAGSNSSHPPTSFTSTTTSSTSSTLSSSRPSISHPNPPLGRKGSLSKMFPNPFDIAAALTNSARGGGGSDGNGNSLEWNTSEGARPMTPESFMIIGEDEGLPTPVRQQRFAAEANVNAGDPSSSSSPYLSVSTAFTNGNGGPSPFSTGTNSPRTTSPVPPNGSSGLSSRRRALLNGLGLDLTPTQSRSGTPTPINTTNLDNNGDPMEGEIKAARASVLAYYQVPPPSPPPTGPLPAPPAPSSSSSSLNTRPVSPSTRQEPAVARNSTQMLSPGRAYASRSPSPLSVSMGAGAGFNNGLGVRDSARYSRSISPGLGGGQVVRRGRESPFPTRPILPPQNRQGLVERVERYKALYATNSGGSDERFEDGVDYENGFIENGGHNGNGNSNENESEVVDRHSSAYIREARARGEKRVYFDTRRYSIKAESYGEYDGVYEDDENGGVGYEYGYGYEGAETNGYTPSGRGIGGSVGASDRDDVDPVMPVPIPDIEINPADKDDDSSRYEDDFDEEADERLRLSMVSPTRQGKDEFEDLEDQNEVAIEIENNTNSKAGLTLPSEFRTQASVSTEKETYGDDSSSTDRRSFAGSSVYSQYSVLDADKSAKLREGLVRRVAALYNGRSGNGGAGKGDEGRLLKEEIPEVPRLPKELRGLNGNGNGRGGGAAGQLRTRSSQYRF